MSASVNDVMQRLQREVVANLPEPQLPERPTVDCTELPEAPAGDPIAREWNVYRREVGRLLAEGHEGRWLLIKGEAVIGIWNSRQEAMAIAAQRFLLQPVLVHQILAREPVVRGTD